MIQHSFDMKRTSISFFNQLMNARRSNFNNCKLTCYKKCSEGDQGSKSCQSYGNFQIVTLFSFQMGKRNKAYTSCNGKIVICFYDNLFKTKKQLSELLYRSLISNSFQKSGITCRFMIILK